MNLFFTGLGIGLGIGAMIAPRSGEQTRRVILDRVGEFAGSARERFREFQQDPERFVEQAKETAREFGDQVSERTKEFASQARDSVQSATAKIGIGPLAAVNTAGRDMLMEVSGIGPVLADRIIEGRPYASARDVVERGILPESAFDELHRHFTRSAA